MIFFIISVTCAIIQFFIGYFIAKKIYKHKQKFSSEIKWIPLDNIILEKWEKDKCGEKILITNGKKVELTYIDWLNFNREGKPMMSSTVMTHFMYPPFPPEVKS